MDKHIALPPIAIRHVRRVADMAVAMRVTTTPRAVSVLRHNQTSYASMSQAYWLLMPIVGISMSKEKDAIDIDMSLTRNWSEVHTTEVVCFWLLRPSAHCLMCRAAGAYSPRGKSHTIPCCRRIQSKERQRDKKARQMSRANHPRASPYEQATRQRSIKSDNTHLLRAEHRGTLANNAPKSSEDK